MWLISYEPLRLLLVKEKMNLRQLIDNKIITPNNSVRINNDTGNITLTTLDKMMNYLTKELNRAVTVEEIIKFIPDEADPKE